MRPLRRPPHLPTAGEGCSRRCSREVDRIAPTYAFLIGGVVGSGGIVRGIAVGFGLHTCTSCGSYTSTRSKVPTSTMA